MDKKFQEILKHNDHQTNIIKSTNNLYNEIITEINLTQKAHFYHTIDFLFKNEHDIIKIIEPIKYTYLDQTSDLKDQYIFIGDYIYNQTYNPKDKFHNNKYCGKWMLFGPLTELIEYWDIIKSKTFQGELGFFSKFIGDENSRLICIYFDDYRDKKKIMSFGNEIKDLVSYPYPMFFKPNRLSGKSYGWGSWIYKIDADEIGFI